MSTSTKRDFKKGLTVDKGKQRREAVAVQLRKDKKEDSLAKRRNVLVNNFTSEEETTVSGENGGVSQSTTTRIYQVSDMPAMMEGMKNNEDVKEQIQVLKGFRRLLSIETNPPVQQCIDCGAVPYFVYFLQRADCMELQFEAAWALTNIASTDKTQLVVECGAVPHLVALLSSGNADIREQSAWCLGNVSGDSAQLRDIVIQNGALEPLIQNILDPASLSLLRNCTWSLSNFCRGKPQPNIATIQAGLPVLGQLVTSNVDQTTTDAAWALSYVSDGDDARIQHVVDLGVVPTLVQMLDCSKAITTVVPALRTLGNIVSGNDLQTGEVVKSGVLQMLAPLLDHSKKNIRKEACWMLSNIAAGNEDQIDQLFQTPNLINMVLENLGSQAVWEVRKEACWVISNIASAGKRKHVVALVELGAIKPLCELLNVGDSKILLVTMEALEAVLKLNADDHSKYSELIDEAGGLDLIEGLQEHENEEVYQRAVRIIETYFGLDEDEESENLAPQVDGNTFSFGIQSTGKAEVDFGKNFFNNTNLQAGATFNYQAPPQAALEAPQFQFNF